MDKVDKVGKVDKADKVDQVDKEYPRANPAPAAMRGVGACFVKHNIVLSPRGRGGLYLEGGVGRLLT
jgi:hypothetical protein